MAKMADPRWKHVGRAWIEYRDEVISKYSDCTYQETISPRHEPVVEPCRCYMEIPPFCQPLHGRQMCIGWPTQPRQPRSRLPLDAQDEIDEIRNNFERKQRRFSLLPLLSYLLDET